MRLFSTLILLTLLSLSPAFAQLRFPVPGNPSPGSYPIDGTHLLDEQERQVRQYIREHPDDMKKLKLSKTAAWNFAVGSSKAWYTQDLTKSQSFYLVPSTCRKVGQYCYIFVEDAIWGSRVNQAAVDSVSAYFDKKTPANPYKGIYQSDVDAFGSPFDVDNDPKIIILIEDIKDGYNGGGYVAGYFTGYNETSQAFSNRAEIYYLDGNPGLGTNPDNSLNMNSLYQAISTTAHEFQHMIFWNYHQSWEQSTFINEGCSMLAEINAGFTARSQSGQYGYNSETNYFLMGWRDVGDDNNLIDYSRASRFFLYLRDQFGMGIFKKLVTSSKFGYQCFNDALTQMGSPLQLSDVYTNFMIANIVDDRSINAAYGYNYSGLPKPTGTVYFNPNASSSGSLPDLSGDYLTFSNGYNLNITFTSGSSSLRVKAFENGPSGKKVVDVPINTPFSVPEFGGGYKTVTFAVVSPSLSNDGNGTTTYSFKSTGGVNSTMELKWDDSEPTGYYNFGAGDSICVTFDPVKGGHLDSIRVALGSAGTITGGVWEASGLVRPTPFGKKLAYPITAASTVTPSKPYPVPFKNWKGIDLRSFNITTDKPFAVGFVFGKNPLEAGIMVADHIGEDPYNSYTYFTPTGYSSNWYYLSSNSNSNAVAIYLVRAYISLEPTDVVEEKGSGIPTKYSLSQNFPNPFNPVTKIRYQIPVSGFVTLKVYDMLGNEVSSLVNEEKSAGEYTVSFDGSRLASGVYFYKLTQGSFTDTKKLILMK
jgi:hypothetical protein